MMESADVIQALGALAQEHRLAVFRLLVRRGPQGLSPGDLSTRLDLAPATLSFHLKELTSAGLLTATRQGRSILYAADYARMDVVMRFLSDHCCVEQPNHEPPGGDATRAAGMACCAPAEPATTQDLVHLRSRGTGKGARP
jgi:ArsR family transcriptional regulator